MIKNKQKPKRIMYKLLCAFVCLALTAGVFSTDVWADEGASTKAAAEVNATCNMTVSLTENKGERAVTWWAPPDTSKSALKYSKNQDFSDAVTVVGTCTYTKSGAFKSYEAKMGGLEENEYYYYKIENTGSSGSAASDSKRIFVGNDSASNSNFSFIYMGDAQCRTSNPEDLEADYAAWGQSLETAATQRPETDMAFCMMGGDMVNDGQNPEEWSEYLKNASKTFSTLNMMSINGNHECNDISTYKPILYKKLFAMPNNGPLGFEEEFYSFDYGSCHIQALNSDVFEQFANGKISQNDMERIKKWMRTDMADSAAEWKIVVTHHPAYAVVADDIATKVLQEWSPVFDEAGVDLVLCGHQHVYMRSKKMLNKQEDSVNGVTYVMGVSGSKMYADNTAPYAEKVVGNTPNYEIIDINGDELTLTAKDREGNTIDTFSLNARDRLTAAKSATETILDSYLADVDKYREEQRQELVLVSLKVRAALREAGETAEVIKIRKDAEEDISKIKTDAQLTEIENTKKNLVIAGVKTASTYNVAAISWTQNSHADGYEIYRSSPSAGSFKLHKTLSGSTAARLRETSLKTGTSYYYRVRAYKSLYGEKVYGSFSTTKVIKPSLAKPSMRVIAGKKKAAVKWSKISGASGYEIYRAVKSKGKYKRIKAVTPGSNVKYYNTRLQKGKKYYYKVRAWRNVSGKKVYGQFSSVKKTKIK